MSSLTRDTELAFLPIWDFCSSMLSNLMIVVGVAALCVALRSFHHPILHRLGTLGIFATSFLAGWLLVGSAWFGLLLALSWLLLPWLEILTRVRKMRLPAQRRLEKRPPPNRNAFPDFSDLTDDVEENGFEFLEDAGWEHEGMRHFYRIFHRPDLRLHAAICLIEQEDLSFYYIAITSKDATGDREFISWNYPFSYGMKMPPCFKINRIDGEQPFTEMVENHLTFLKENGLTAEETSEQPPERICEEIRRSVEKQISHNLEIGLLVKDADNFLRYSVRGMFFLWFQFLRDLVRFS